MHGEMKGGGGEGEREKGAQDHGGLGSLKQGVCTGCRGAMVAVEGCEK